MKIEKSVIDQLRNEAKIIETGENPAFSYRQSNEFDHDGENISYVLSISKSGYAELLLPSRTIVKTVLPQKAAEKIHEGDVLVIVVETGMSSSGNLKINIKRIKRLGGSHNEYAKAV